MKQSVQILSFLALIIWAASCQGQQYNIIRQGVCWTDTSGVDSSLTRLVYVSISGAGPTSVRYVNAAGSAVDVSAGGSFEMGYCGCCADTTAIDFLYYSDGDTIIDGDTILFNQYDNHIFLSQNGNNATGELGNFNRPFSDPWAAQDILSGQTNLSFLAYQGNYSYTGVGAGNEFTRVDTFTLLDFSNSSYSMLNISGGNSSPFITDRTNSTNSRPQRIYIDAKNSDFIFSDLLSLGLFGGVYNKNSSLFFHAKNVVATGGRVWGIQTACPYVDIDLDTLLITGGVALSQSYDFTATATGDTITQNLNYNAKIKYISTDDQVADDDYGAIRFQANSPGPQYIFEESIYNIDVDKLSTRINGGVFIDVGNGTRDTLRNSTLKFRLGEFEKRVGQNTSAVLLTQLNGGPAIENTKIDISIEKATENQSGIVYFGAHRLSGAPGISFSGNSYVNIRLGEIATQGGAVSNAAILVDELTLSDSAIVRIHCDDCRVNDDYVIRITQSNIPDGTKLIFSGNYTLTGGGAMVYIDDDNIDLSGLSFENATFKNDGARQWIEAEAATTIDEISGLWSNSDSLINVTLQGNNLWGFSSCGSSFTDLQTIIDSLCNRIDSLENINYTDSLYNNGDTLYYQATTGRIDTVLQEPLWQNGTALATTDGSGDITITFPVAQPDATYTALLSSEGSAFYYPQVQTRNTTNMVVRFFDSSGAAVTSTGVVCGWAIRDR